MITKHVIGQRIVKVRQCRVWLDSRRCATTVDYIELSNGVKLLLHALETETEPVGDLIVNEVNRK